MENTESAISEEQKKSRGNRKERVGIVASDCQEKTIVVEVVRRTAHKLYKKVIKKKKRYVAHDEKNEAKAGDTVNIVETKPYSKTKNWRLVKVLEKKI